MNLARPFSARKDRLPLIRQHQCDLSIRTADRGNLTIQFSISLVLIDGYVPTAYLSRRHCHRAIHNARAHRVLSNDVRERSWTLAVEIWLCPIDRDNEVEVLPLRFASRRDADNLSVFI